MYGYKVFYLKIHKRNNNIYFIKIKYKNVLYKQIKKKLDLNNMETSNEKSLELKLNNYIINILEKQYATKYIETYIERIVMEKSKYCMFIIN